MSGRSSYLRDETPTPTRLLKVFGRNSSFLDDIITDDTESESLNTPVIPLTASSDHPLASISFSTTNSSSEKESPEVVINKQPEKLSSPSKTQSQEKNPKIRIQRLTPVVGKSPDDDERINPAPRRTGRKPKPIDLDIITNVVKRKPGRKPKVNKSKESPCSSPQSESPSDPKLAKKQKLESNREAAQRCRVKRRMWMQDLVDKSLELQKKNDSLQVSFFKIHFYFISFLLPGKHEAYISFFDFFFYNVQEEINNLRSQVKSLSTALKAHSNCSVTLQQVKIIGSLTPSSSQSTVVSSSQSSTHGYLE
jgi:hypothetical protein